MIRHSTNNGLRAVFLSVWRSAGFTLIELIVVIVLMTILAVVAFTRLDRETFSEYGYAEETLSALRYARQTAIARNTSVTVALTGNAFQICVDTSCPPTTAGAYLTNPASGLPWDGSTAKQGKAPDGVSIQTTLNTITFDGLGRPSSSGSISIGSHTLTIEPETGYVH